MKAVHEVDGCRIGRRKPGRGEPADYECCEEQNAYDGEWLATDKVAKSAARG